MTEKPKATTLAELYDYAKAFEGWFHDFVPEIQRAPLSWRERDKIYAFFDDIANITEEIADVVERAQRWEAEK